MHTTININTRPYTHTHDNTHTHTTIHIYTRPYTHTHTKSQLCLLLITPRKDSMTHILRFFFLLLQCRKPYAVIQGLVLLMMGIMMPETRWDRSLIINIELVASCWFIFLQYKVLLDSILYECGIIVILWISYSCFIFLKLDREEHCKGRRLHAARSLLIVNLRRLCTRFHAPKDEYHFETGRSRQNSHDCHIFP